jgi:sarcosine oxidase subunit alpha
MTHARGPFRVDSGGSVGRQRPISFRFNGRSLSGFFGDSLASALLANGVRTITRSFKFHRPRGIFSAGPEEPNALVQLGAGARTLVAARAPVTELTEDLVARSPRGWPHVNWDFGRVFDLTPSLWAAGFYNKTFIWPNWHTYERLIRRMAGLGRAPTAPDPDRYETVNLHCDVLIVGGGLAGLKAALACRLAGQRIVLVEQDRRWGGSAAWETGTTKPAASTADIAAIVERLMQLPDARLLTRTTAAGIYDHGVVTLLERVPPDEAGRVRERFWIVRTGRVILATGVIEQPLIFAGNDRPGIYLARSAQEYLQRYGVAVGREVLIATNNDTAYPLAIDLKQAGVRVLGVADTRHQVPQEFRSLLQLVDIRLFSGSIPIKTTGFSALKSVTLGRLNRDGWSISSSHTIQCDALAVSGGFNPALALYAQAGGKLTYDSASGALLPRAPLPGVEIVGSASDNVPIGPRLSPEGPSNRQWVDLLHDVTVADLELALRENYTAIEHVKRYTTVGMAADQGKTSAPGALGVIGRLRGMAASALGHTTLRPPVTPVTLGAIVGRQTRERFAPHRTLPMHNWHVSYGALMQEFGEWRRPVAYLKSGETREEAVRREARSVRHGVGLFDGSSLGKIEVQGPDALSFLDRFYINDLTTLKPYRARYGLMLRETGTLFDDGTVVMLAKDRFLLTTTSGNAGRVGQWLEEWHQCEWPQLQVAIVPVTECWATVSLAGPQSRDLMMRLPSDIDFATDQFPHLSMREGTLCGMLARIYRVSFTGELTYEINVPATQGAVLWEALMQAGGDTLEPFGLDALMLLRLEKGFLHLGADTDGTSIPDDVGWGKVAANKKGDYIGKRSLRLPEHLRSDRLQLIGLMGESAKPFVIGSHLRVKDSKNATDGWVTSAGTAVLSGEPIALAMVRSGRARIGETVVLYDDGAPVGRARVVNPPFYDSSGDRMNG